MANDIKNWAKRQKVGDRNAKVILLEIADVANAGGYSWYAIPTIAETLEASPKTVERGIAYLVKKGFITRTTREKIGGKFRSKGTQINIPTEDWDNIVEERKSRPKPTDNLTIGQNKPPVKLSVGEEKPTVILSETDQNQQSFCPKPTDNLTIGQNDALTISNKEYILEPSEEPKEREAHTPAPDANQPSQTFLHNFQNYAFLMNLDLWEIHEYFFKKAHTLSPKDKQIIQNRIIDKRAWIESLIFWDENNYLAKSIGKQCDKYDEILIERVKKTNGKIQPTYKSNADKRDERIINEFDAIQEVRNRVEERRRKGVP